MRPTPDEFPEFSPRLARAARVLTAGGVVAYPTEGVYGIGCLPSDDAAIARILAIKRRSWRKGLALIGASFEQLEPLVVLPDGGLRQEILDSWPGPFTWVLTARPGVSRLVTGGRGTVAVRVTAHPLASALCRRAHSALVSTSANRSERAPLLTALAVRRELGAELDDVLAGRLGGLDGPTPIRDGTTGRYFRGS
jgi:L-threonylcarbamoyladenylate synthase